MGKIIQLDEMEEISSKLHDKNKKIVLVGGCFDILHVAHITFLDMAKKAGDVLVVEVESDERIRKLKGIDRPINSQLDRVYVLSRLEMVDFVIPLPMNLSDEDYFTVTKKVRPNVLATTKGDPKNIYLYRQAKLLGIVVKEVLSLIQDRSTSKLVKTLGLE